MELEIFNIPDPSGKMAKESYVLKNFKKEYDYIIEYCSNIVVPTFKEKVYLSINNLNSIPTCKNPNCNNTVKFKNTTLGYLDYCCNKCIGSDPSIIKLKEEKSLLKFGTKSPAESKIIKDKIIKTNNEKYGGNSPMSNKDIQKKSKETLLENWGVTNASKSPELLNKRIESFKKGNYKENFKKTSLERYGTEHPWSNKEIHIKTINFFYKNYKNRIIQKTSTEFEFIGFVKDNNTNLQFICKKCNQNFEILTYQFYYRSNNNNSICTKCFPISENSSIDQAEIFNFIKEKYKGEIISNARSIISPYEVDIYLPELKLGIEFNGVFWHSEKFKNKNYHLDKYNKSIENGMRLITIWEDDWTIKNEICKSFILNKIGLSNRIFARNCQIKEITNGESVEFLNDNHLQGNCISSKRVGLFNNNTLVSLMTFSSVRLPVGGKNKQNTLELTRFCNLNNTSVIGGASKILKYVIEKYKPECIETYSDNLISDGNLYQKLGFEYSHTSRPGYWYLINGVREHRFNWRKQRLVDMGYDKNKTEEEIMLELGNHRIYNAGNKKWILNTI